MVTPSFHRNPQSASAILYVLIIVAITGVVLTASLQTIATRAKFHEETLLNSQRRITLDNSRALATQYLRQYVLPRFLTGNVEVTAPGNMGSFLITGPSIPPLAVDPTSSTLQGYNHFSPGELGGYAVRYDTTLRDGAGGTSLRHFYARSRSPIFSGNLMNAQLPATGVSVGESVVAGRTILWTPNSPNSYLIRTSTYLVPSVVNPSLLTDLDGSYSLPSNFPLVPQTSGAIDNTWDIEKLGYNGAISVIRPTSDPAPNSLYAKVPASWHINPKAQRNDNGIVSDGIGFVSIDLLGPGLQAIYIGDGLKTLRLIGQTTPAQSTDALNRFALLIVIEESGAPTAANAFATVQLTGENARRLYIAIKKETASTVTFRAEPLGTATSWRMAGVMENTPITWNMGTRHFTMKGGLRTNSSYQITNGSLSIVEDESPENLELRADRSTWLESFTPANVIE